MVNDCGMRSSPPFFTVRLFVGCMHFWNVITKCCCDTVGRRGGEISADTYVATESTYNNSDTFLKRVFNIVVGGATQQRKPGDGFYPAGKAEKGSGTEMKLLRRPGDTDDREGVSMPLRVRETDYCKCAIMVRWRGRLFS